MNVITTFTLFCCFSSNVTVELVTMLPLTNKRIKFLNNLEYQFEINIVGKEFFQHFNLLYKPSPTSKHDNYTI